MNERRRARAARSVWIKPRAPKVSHYPYYPHYPYYWYDEPVADYDYDYDDEDYYWDDLDGYRSTWITENPRAKSTWITENPRARSSWIGEDPRARSSWIGEDYKPRSSWINWKEGKGYKSKTYKKNPYIVLDAPLMIALLEYAREKAETDKEVHTMVEEMLEMIDSYGPLDMECFDYITGTEEGEESYKANKTKATVVMPPPPPPHPV